MRRAIAATSTSGTTRGGMRRQAAQTPGITDLWRPRLRPTPSPNAPDAPPLRGSWTAMDSHASCLAMRPPPGHWLLPRRQARARVVPPALAQHHSTRKACHYSRRFLVPIHPRNGILLILLIKPVDSPKKNSKKENLKKFQKKWHFAYFTY